MKKEAKTPDEYIRNCPADRIPAMTKLRQTILKNLPEGFEEVIIYGMIGYVVPHSVYPNGYHCDPKQPIPFINIASQKNFVALYHSGIFEDKKLLEWFQREYPKYCTTKLDMGKSCIRFKNVEKIPYELISELVRKVSVEEWLAVYEASLT